MKKKLLVLAYEYYPTENANTRIIRNTCGILSETYGIDLVTVKKPGPEEAEKFRVIRVPEYSFHREKCTGTVTPLILARMAAEKALGKLAHDETRMLERLYGRGIRKAVRVSDYDAVLSFSAPFLPHGCASRLVRGTGVPWIAVCLDPYFSHRIFGPERLEERKKREEAVMEAARKVIITYPTDRDYLRAGVAFRDKIIGAEMPGIAPKGTAPKGSDPFGTRCGFFGSLYREIRDPRAAVALFSRITGEEITMTFAGGLADGTKEEFFPEGCGCAYAGELHGEALQRQYAETDVLVNIGNAVDNQMPSKIFEYISTGKPVINIYKSPECPTLKYLERYPLALNLYERDITEKPEESAEKARAFCLAHRGERVDPDIIGKLFAGNTFEAFAETLDRALRDETAEPAGKEN